jgi:fucokinase
MLRRQALADRRDPVIVAGAESSSAMPLRIRFAGGWTDTPPHCLKHDAAVLNAAVRLESSPAALPIRVHCSAESPTGLGAATATPPPEISSSDVTASITFRAADTTTSAWTVPRGSPISDMLDPARVPDDFRVAAVSAAVALFPRATYRWWCLRENHSADPSDGDACPIAQQLLPVNVTVDIFVDPRVPRGSGLGTSSILAACVIDALLGLDASRGSETGAAAQRSYPWVWIVAQTMAVEQLVGTCGGWQDMTGALVPGFKLGTSTPLAESLATASTSCAPVTYGAQRIADPTGALAVLVSTRIALIFSGVTRNSGERNADVMAGFVAGDRATLEMLARLRELAHEQHALFSGLATATDVAQLAQLEQRLGATMRETHTLDGGGCPAAVQAAIDDLCASNLGAHLLGSGAGGFIMVLLGQGSTAESATAIAQRHLPNARHLPCHLASGDS